MNKAVPLIVVIFLGFWMFTDTNGFVDTMQSAGSFGVDMIGSLFTKLVDVIEQF